mgnify:CR=1 FL=1
MKLKAFRTINGILAGIFVALAAGLLWLTPIVCKYEFYSANDMALEGLKSLYSWDFGSLLYIIVFAILCLSAVFAIVWIINSIIAKKAAHSIGALYALIVTIVVAAAVMAFFSLDVIGLSDYKDPTNASIILGTFFHYIRAYDGDAKFMFKALSFATIILFALSLVFVILYAFMDFFSLVADGSAVRKAKGQEPVIEKQTAGEDVESTLDQVILEGTPVSEEPKVVAEEPVVEEKVEAPVVEEKPGEKAPAESNIRIVPEGTYVIHDKKTREELFYQACVDTGDYVVFDEVDFGSEKIENLDDVKIVKEIHVK